MLATTSTRIVIFVDKSNGQWIVLDSDGAYWIVLPGENAWDDRQPFYPDENSELLRVPSHYRHLLNLPP